jgi:hypothetical protein
VLPTLAPELRDALVGALPADPSLRPTGRELAAAFGAGRPTQ